MIRGVGVVCGCGVGVVCGCGVCGGVAVVWAMCGASDIG